MPTMSEILQTAIVFPHYDYKSSGFTEFKNSQLWNKAN